MNKNILIKEVSKQTKITNKDCKVCVEALLDIITKSLKVGDDVALKGFGSFLVATKKGRYYVNPQTKNKTFVKTKNVVKFKPSKQINIG